ncbi:hypothetical protein AURDEDRAFT_110015 [Auricularia subglabra TFB-10046 SS5]|nr:hypothetical protein AURDEDRAFT_110015 [Auricularia subglabra TFB-10046 SS5]
MSSDVFRCSPWVAYEPPPNEPDADPDGAAPAGSPQDPPPEPGRAFTKFRVKLRAADGGGDAPPDAPPTDGVAAAGAVAPDQATSADQLAMMNTFELGPNQDWKAAAVKPPRKKPAKRGAAAGGAGIVARGGIRKAATIKNAQRVAAEGDDLPDDASFASSPVLGPRDTSIEPEATPQASSPARQTHTPQPQPILLPDDPGPAPSYPAPVKGFAVAPPVKPQTVSPREVQVDRTSAPVRRWRIARREIRGIAGGRWFARAWVGNKDSEWASASAAAQLLSMAAGPSASSTYAATTSKPGKHTTRIAGSSLATPIALPSSSPVRPGRDDGEDVAMLEL